MADCVVVDGGDEGSCVAFGGILCAGEVADGFANKDGYDYDHYQNADICGRGDKHGEHRVVVEDVIDGDINCSNTRLF